MKTSAIFGIVGLAHCVAIGGIFLIQGCETTKPSTQDTVESVIMPPSRVVPTSLKTSIKPVVTEWPAETTDYVVKSGDSISSIAYRHGVAVSEIVALNGIANKNIIKVGQQLVLPGKVNVSAAAKKSASTSSSAKQSVSSSKTADVGSGAYIVKPGDCLGTIAKNYGVKVDDIRQANGVQGEKIIVGQKLVIPGVKIADPKVNAEAKVTTAEVLPVANDISKQPDKVASKVEAVAESRDPASVKSVITETHVVQKGEDLRRISMQWLVSEDKIREYNKITDGELKPGQVLLIPLSE